MSEVETVTADAAAPETAAPATPATETTVPDKPASSAREAVERAMTKVGGEQSAAEKPASVDRGDGRDAQGKFAAKAGDAKPAEAAKPESVKPDAKPAEAKPVEVKPEDIGKPPQRFSKAAQEEWAKTPPAIRTEVERAIGELTQGIEKYRGAAESYEAIRQFDEMARQSGTTLDRALQAYTGIESALRNDPAQGFLAIAQNMGADPVKLFQHIGETLATAAARQGLPNYQQQRQAQPDPQLAALSKEIQDLKAGYQEQQSMAVIERFASDPAHPHFDELLPTITQLLETKFAKDLPDAYEKAVRLTPEIAAKIEASKAVTPQPKAPLPDPAQTREKATKSITGSPGPGSAPVDRKPAGSAREALQSAFAQVGLG